MAETADFTENHKNVYDLTSSLIFKKKSQRRECLMKT